MHLLQLEHELWPARELKSNIYLRANLVFYRCVKTCHFTAILHLEK
jgi:hypothetical protein